MGVTIEFIVPGIPASAGARIKKRPWKAAVENAAQHSAELHQQDDKKRPLRTVAFYPVVELKVTIVYFYIEKGNVGLDNLAKPILDAMTGIIFGDDSQVVELRVRKSGWLLPSETPSAPQIVLDALHGSTDFVYVKVGRDVDHKVMP